MLMWACVCALGVACKHGSSVTLANSCSQDSDCESSEVCDLATERCIGGSAADGGVPDSTSPGDAGPGDSASPSDASPSDSGVPDGGSADSNPSDTGTPTVDAMVVDAMRLDANRPQCGDRVVIAPETCDDGNTMAGDGCDQNCQREPSASCGDGNLDLPFEECDDGNTNANDGCSAQCRVEITRMCGDGTLDLSLGEECDDGANVDGDGCSSTCQFETVGAFCGDDLMDANEVCDDGNLANGDGCNPTCNLVGDVTTFVGAVGMSGTRDGVGSAARLRGGVIAADDRYIWYAENGDCRNNRQARLRRVEIATADVSTVRNWNGLFRGRHCHERQRPSVGGQQ